MSVLMILKIAGAVFLLLFLINWICQVGSLIRKFWFGDFILIALFMLVMIRLAPFFNDMSRRIDAGMNFVEGGWRLYSEEASEHMKAIRQESALFMKGMKKKKLGDRMKYQVP